MMVELLKRKRKMNMNILLKRLISYEIFDYLHDSQVEGRYPDDLQWWCKIGSKKYLQPVMLAKGFLLVCASRFPSERLFS